MYIFIAKEYTLDEWLNEYISIFHDCIVYIIQYKIYVFRW